MEVSNVPGFTAEVMHERKTRAERMTLAKNEMKHGISPQNKK